MRRRILELFAQTTALAILASLVAVPLGVAIGLAMARFRFPRFATLLWIAVFTALAWPLPVVALAWQIILSDWVGPLRLTPGAVAWQPWQRGLLPAAILHGLAAWPMVTLIVVARFRFQNSPLDDLAQLELSTWQRWRFVDWPRLRLPVGLGLCWVVWQCLTEIAITDAFMVRSFAEEIYTQIVGGARVDQAVLLATLPAPLLVGWVCWWGLQKWVAHRATGESTRHRSGGALQNAPSGVFLGLVGLLFVLVGLPLCALLLRTAGSRSAEGLSMMRGLVELWRVLQTDGSLLLRSLVEGALGGFFIAGFAMLTVAWGFGSRWRMCMIAGLVISLLGCPAPVVGFGLKTLILTAVELEQLMLESVGLYGEFPPVRSGFYDQPSPLPGWLASGARWWPFAVIWFYLTASVQPQVLWEQAKLDGLSRWQQKRNVFGIRLWASGSVAVVWFGLQSMTEVGATKLVNPPFRPTYILRLFDMMHYGPESTVAALAVWQAGLAAIFGIYLARWVDRAATETPT